MKLKHLSNLKISDSFLNSQYCKICKVYCYVIVKNGVRILSVCPECEKVNLLFPENLQKYNFEVETYKKKRGR